MYAKLDRFTRGKGSIDRLQDDQSLIYGLGFNMVGSTQSLGVSGVPRWMGEGTVTMASS